MLNSDSKLYPHHLNDERTYDYFSKPVAEVVRHPTDPRIWGLKNLTTEKWVATISGGVMKDIEPGRSLPLASGSRVNFGKVEGELKY